MKWVLASIRQWHCDSGRDSGGVLNYKFPNHENLAKSIILYWLYACLSSLAVARGKENDPECDKFGCLQTCWSLQDILDPSIYSTLVLCHVKATHEIAIVTSDNKRDFSTKLFSVRQSGLSGYCHWRSQWVWGFALVCSIAVGYSQEDPNPFFLLSFCRWPLARGSFPSFWLPFYVHSVPFGVGQLERLVFFFETLTPCSVSCWIISWTIFEYSWTSWINFMNIQLIMTIV